MQGKGGFDVVMGNPPYVEYAKVQKTYSIRNDLRTIECGNLYVYVLETSLNLKSNEGVIGFIIPISFTAAQRMKPIQHLLFRRNAINYLSNFALRPAALFPGVMQRLSIILHKNGVRAVNNTTDYLTWYNDERDILFVSKLKYHDIDQLLLDYSIPKVNCPTSLSSVKKILAHQKYWTTNRFNEGKHRIYYHNAGGYWVKTFSFKPYYKSLTVKDKKHTTISELCFGSQETASVYLLAMNCSVFYYFWKTVTDARHIYPCDIVNFPFNYPLSVTLTSQMVQLQSTLMQSFIKSSERIVYGNAEVDQFRISPSKPIIDQIDCLLAQHYGFTHEELDFIINYDIKY
ncbi:MAG: Eco57I restriction-modification methylase domain-containing protein, partial [Candidatus Subteraquimicrobiales bacterium]|nr:Eco57I restriction-modification methylase domain-containing protein [Candidatus Subteraquimicrobiales bacterium]